MRLDFELPPEDGRYQAFISPMREGVCWYYERGWPFLLVDTAVATGGRAWSASRVATRATLRRERALRHWAARSPIRC